MMPSTHPRRRRGRGWPRHRSAIHTRRRDCRRPSPAGPATASRRGGWLPTERLPLHAALAAYTSGGAWQAFEEDTAGTITVGKRANPALVGADVPALADVELAGVPVVGTRLAGVPVLG
jgi:predicted amidohydrolase YtcJ